MNPTRRRFFRVLLGAVATVPVLLTGNPTRAAQAGALEQDRIDNLVRRFRASMVESDRTMAETIGSMRIKVRL